MIRPLYNISVSPVSIRGLVPLLWHCLFIPLHIFSLPFCFRCVTEYGTVLDG